VVLRGTIDFVENKIEQKMAREQPGLIFNTKSAFWELAVLGNLCSTFFLYLKQALN
jgi:hypothetical protein